jgi:hypothetical protein
LGHVPAMELPTDDLATVGLVIGGWHPNGFDD